MRDSSVVLLYGVAKKRLDLLGFEVVAGGVFTVHRKGSEALYLREVANFESAESLHAFALGIEEKAKAMKKTKAKKKVKKKKGKKR